MITQDDVLYLIVTDRFCDGDPENNAGVDRGQPKGRHGGDLRGILKQLPYLRELGVTTLWITPVYVNPVDSYHGYHPLDFERVDPHLCSPELGPAGSREVLRRFVETAHQAGFKVVLDMVVNHTALDHPWLRERPEWFNCDEPNAEKCWLWGLPDLNHDQVDVNAYFVENVLTWITESGVDGIRLDATRNVETRFWELFKLYAHGLRPDCTLIGEVWDPSPSRVAPFQTLHGFDSMFDFPLQIAAAEVFAGGTPFTRLAAPELYPGEEPGVLNQDPHYRTPYQLVTFLDNHDTPRFFTQCGGLEGGVEALSRLKLALTFLLTSRGIPQLYYGTELGMEGGDDPDNRRDMPWEWVDGEARPAHAREMLEFTRSLVRLRRSSNGLRFGAQVTLFATPTLYAYVRAFPGDPRVVVLNNSPDPAEVRIPLHSNPRLPVDTREAVANGAMLSDDLHPGTWAQVEDGHLCVRMDARSGSVYRLASLPHPMAG